MLSLILCMLYTNHSLGGVDYTAGLYTVTFPAGQTGASFGITIYDDNILEGSETFTIEVDSSSLLTGVSVGGTSQATVAIDNDDCKLQTSILKNCKFKNEVWIYAIKSSKTRDE